MRSRATRSNVTPSFKGSKSLARELSEGQRIDRLSHTLLRTRDVTAIPTADLCRVSNYLRDSVPTLFNSSDLTLARAVISLADRIEAELEFRCHFVPQKEMPRSPEQFARLESFDAATRSSMEAIEQRHHRLHERFTELWESQMKSRYFAPAPKLQMLRQRAIDLEREGRKSELKAAIIAASVEEEKEAAIAQQQFQHDYDVACARMKRKRKLEIEAFQNDRMSKRRGLLGHSRSASVSRVISPRPQTRV
jgi:hypothetical protein